MTVVDLRSQWFNKSLLKWIPCINYITMWMLQYWMWLILRSRVSSCLLIQRYVNKRVLLQMVVLLFTKFTFVSRPQTFWNCNASVNSNLHHVCLVIWIVIFSRLKIKPIRFDYNISYPAARGIWDELKTEVANTQGHSGRTFRSIPTTQQRKCTWVSLRWPCR